jgi:hypothetical protein
MEQAAAGPVQGVRFALTGDPVQEPAAPDR